MYLSKLTLNPRSRGARHDLANLYEMHRTLLRAFSDDQGAESSVLYRADTERRTGIVTVIVQSAINPDWSFFEGFDSYLLKPPQSKGIDLTFKEEQPLRFRLRANPSKRVSTNEDGSRAGYIKGLYKPDEQEEWLRQKGENGGFQIHSILTVPEGNLEGRKNRSVITFYSVLFEGILLVKDVETFLRTVERGIGRGKRFGFGLLSVAPFSGR